MTLGTAGVNAVDDIFSQDSNSIKELREQLKSLVSEIKTWKQIDMEKLSYM